jgi:hypothetical protein
LIAQITQISYFLLPLLFILGCYFYSSLRRLKEAETKKLNLLYAEITSEKEVAHQLNKTPKEIEKINNSIHNKLLKIKVDVFNLDYSLTEIF